PGLDSSVLTLMSNIMFVPNIGPVRPYAVAGVGLMKTRVEFTPNSLLETTNNDFAWTAGGGIIVQVAPHVGLRGDLRHFQTFKDFDVAGFPITNTKINFGRASGGVVFTF